MGGPFLVETSSLCGEAFGLVAEEEAVDESLDELFVLVCESCGGF